MDHFTSNSNELKGNFADIIVLSQRGQHVLINTVLLVKGLQMTH